MRLCQNVKQVYGSHFTQSFHALIKSSLPVFVAASLSRAALALIFLIPSTVPSIAAAIMYALCCCHAIGTFVAVSLEANTPTHKYYISLATETTGFAWKECVMLLIFNRHGHNIQIVQSVVIWIAVVSGVVIIVCLSAYIAHTAVKLPPHSEKHLSKFRSEVFSLSIAYSFTLLVAYGIYWQQRDDTSVYAVDDADVSTDDDNASDSTKLLSHMLFLLYTIALTYLTAIIQSYDSVIFGEFILDDDQGSENGASAAAALSGGDIRDAMSDQTLERDRSAILQAATTAGPPSEARKSDDSDGSDARCSSVRLTDDSRGVLSTHINNSHPQLAVLYGQLFSWDTRFLLMKSLRTFLDTTQG
jgi:hypothetical protein